MQTKALTLLTMCLLLAFCGLLVTLAAERTGGWAFLVAPLAVTVVFCVGPPRRHPATSVVRLLLAVPFMSVELFVIGALLLACEFGDAFLMPRLFAAGAGGALPSARETRAIRVAGLRKVRSHWRGRVSAWRSSVMDALEG
jgi:hypothetical protein